MTPQSLKFRTNAKCEGCVARIGAELEKILPKGSWIFDLSSPDKTLTVTLPPVDARDIVEAVKAAGYTAVPI